MRWLFPAIEIEANDIGYAKCEVYCHEHRKHWNIGDGCRLAAYACRLSWVWRLRNGQCMELFPNRDCLTPGSCFGG